MPTPAGRPAAHIIERGLSITGYTTTDNPVSYGELGTTNDRGGQRDTPQNILQMNLQIKPTTHTAIGR
ncbi:MAG: hypothetical protein K0U84_02290 [Actinomycetia bacterium]|nr:hypothetical protein [Actinomycetes bacterium]